MCIQEIILMESTKLLGVDYRQLQSQAWRYFFKNIQALKPGHIIFLRNMAQIPAQFIKNDDICALKSFEPFRNEDQEQEQGKIQTLTRLPVTPSLTIQSRSRKQTGQVNYEISFESGILDNHIDAFETIWRKYSEVVNKINCSQEFKLVQNLNSHNKTFDYVQWLQSEIKSSPGLSSTEKLQLIEDWRKQQNLSKFLKTITDGFQPRLGAEFIYLTYLIWEVYLKCTNLRLDQEEKVSKIVDTLSSNIESIFHANELKQLTFKEVGQEDAKEAFNQFVRAYAETVYLVVEEYFQNSVCLSSSYSFDRNSSLCWAEMESENCQLRGLPRKMPKLF